MLPKYVDVLLEVPVAELLRQDDPTGALYELMLRGAVDKCAEVGARVDAGLGPVEARVEQAQHPLLGDMTLVASRWAVIQ
jgi:hypothetical protein